MADPLMSNTNYNQNPRPQGGRGRGPGPNQSGRGPQPQGPPGNQMPMNMPPRECSAPPDPQDTGPLCTSTPSGANARALPDIRRRPDATSRRSNDGADARCAPSHASPWPLCDVSSACVPSVLLVGQRRCSDAACPPGPNGMQQMAYYGMAPGMQVCTIISGLQDRPSHGACLWSLAVGCCLASSSLLLLLPAPSSTRALPVSTVACHNLPPPQTAADPFWRPVVHAGATNAARRRHAPRSRLRRNAASGRTLPARLPAGRLCAHRSMLARCASAHPIGPWSSPNSTALVSPGHMAGWALPACNAESRGALCGCPSSQVPMTGPQGAGGAYMAAGVTGQARPMYAQPPAGPMYAQPPGRASQQQGSIQPIQAGMRPAPGPGGAAMTIPGKGAGGASGGPPAPAGPPSAGAPPAAPRAKSSAIRIVNPDTMTEIELPEKPAAPPSAAEPMEGDTGAPSSAPVVMEAPADHPMSGAPPLQPPPPEGPPPKSAEIVAELPPQPSAVPPHPPLPPGAPPAPPLPPGPPPTSAAVAIVPPPAAAAAVPAAASAPVPAPKPASEAKPEAAKPEAAAPAPPAKPAEPPSAPPAAASTAPPPIAAAPASSAAATTPANATPSAAAAAADKPAPATEAKPAEVAVSSSASSPPKSPPKSAEPTSPSKSAAGGDDDDDDWESKDDSQLIISEEPDKKAGPPGISLRPGGGGMSGFSSATKAVPGASGGKKTYDKEFILQFAPHCTERPDSLPDMEITILGSTGEPIKGGGGRGGGPPPGLAPDEWRRVQGRGGGEKGGKGGGGPGADRFSDPRDPRNNQFQKGGAGGKGGGKGKDGRSKPLVGFEFKELEKSENAWQPLSKTKEEIDAMVKLQRTTKALLNKFAPEKFEKLSLQFLELEIKTRTDMVAVIDLVFDKALYEPIFGEMYSMLCVRCAEKFPEFADETNPEGKAHTFKRLLLNKCQEEFEKENTIDYSEAETAEAKEVLRKAAKIRMLGNIIFISELYKTRMLTEKIMHECVIKLLGDVKNPDLDEVECLVKLLKGIGKLIDHPKAKDHMDSYFARIKEMSQNPELPNRVRFMLQETMDLRRGQWVMRKEDPAEKARRAAAAKAEAAAAKAAAPDRNQQGRGDMRGGADRGGPQRGAPPARVAPPQQQQQQRGQEPPSRGGAAAGKGGASKPAAAGAAPSSAPSAAPPLTTEQMTNRINSSLEEYFVLGDTKEFLACIAEIVARLPEGKVATDVGLEAVQSAIPKAIESRPEEPRDRVASMFGPLAKANYLKAAELKTFFVESCEFLEDEICDVPLIATWYAKFIGHAVADGVLEMGFLTEALAPLVGAELCREAAAIDGNRGAAFMAASILQVIKGREGGEEAAKRAYASFDLTALMPEGSKTAVAVVSLLEAAELAYVDPSLAEQARSAAEVCAALSARAAYYTHHPSPHLSHRHSHHLSHSHHHHHHHHHLVMRCRSWRSTAWRTEGCAGRCAMSIPTRGLCGLSWAASPSSQWPLAGSSCESCARRKAACVETPQACTSCAVRTRTASPHVRSSRPCLKAACARAGRVEWRGLPPGASRSCGGALQVWPLLPCALALISLSLSDPPTYPPTYPPTHPPTYPPTYPPTHLPTHLPTYPPTAPLRYARWRITCGKTGCLLQPQASSRR